LPGASKRASGSTAASRLRRCVRERTTTPRCFERRVHQHQHQHQQHGRVSVVARATTGRVSVGDAAPEFELLAGGFQQVKLSDYEGKKLVLAFFPCCFSGAVDDGCQCQLESLKTLTDAGVSVLGVSRDQPFTQKAWMDKIGNPSLLTLSDFNLDVSEEYVGTFNFGAFLDGLGVSKGLTGYLTSNRGTIAINEEGKIVYKWIALDDAGKSHPGFLPDIEEVKKALGV